MPLTTVFALDLIGMEKKGKWKIVLFFSLGEVFEDYGLLSLLLKY